MKSWKLQLLWMAWALPLISSPAATLYVDANGANPISPYSSWNNAATNIQDALNASTNGDLVLVTNGIFHGGILATNRVAIQSVNGAAATWIDGNHTTGCANLAGEASLTGFTLTNGYAFNGGGVFCADTNVLISSCIIVSNTAWGNYSGGAFSGTLTNCTLMNNNAANGGGAAFSTLNHCTLSGNVASYGGGANLCTLNNCVLIGNQGGWGGGAIGSTLTGCRLTNNSAAITASSVSGSEAVGGGTFGGTADNCVYSGNQALNPYNDTRVTQGGGAYAGVLNNCILFKNKANIFFGSGGAACAATLNNCSVVGNSSATCGGTLNCTVKNSIVRFNGSDYSGGTLNYCFVTPLPAGVGNNTSDPVFVDKLNGDLRLQSNSPCINSGKNSFITNSTDLAGNPRIVAGTVDVGAYEYQSPLSTLSYAWAQQFGLATDGTADGADPDSDGMNNWQEWIAGTTPTNAASLLQMLPPASTNASGLTVSWLSVTNKTYYLQRASDLSGLFLSLQSNLVGQAGITSFTDTNATDAGPYFYRVGVQY